LSSSDGKTDNKKGSSHMSSITELERSLAEVFQSGGEFEVAGLEFTDGDIFSGTVREIRTDLADMMLSRPSGN
jgi:hypothetical protein